MDAAEVVDIGAPAGGDRTTSEEVTPLLSATSFSCSFGSRELNAPAINLTWAPGSSVCTEPSGFSRKPGTSSAGARSQGQCGSDPPSKTVLGPIDRSHQGYDAGSVAGGALSGAG